MDSSLNTSHFQENLLRLYLGKYESRFKPIRKESGVVLCTDPHPLLVVQLWADLSRVSLAEYIEVEKDDPYYGSFEHYQIDIITVPIEDPSGVKSVETAVAKSFLAGTQL